MKQKKQIALKSFFRNIFALSQEYFILLFYAFSIRIFCCQILYTQLPVQFRSICYILLIYLSITTFIEASFQVFKVIDSVSCFDRSLKLIKKNINKIKALGCEIKQISELLGDCPMLLFYSSKLFTLISKNYPEFKKRPIYDISICSQVLFREKIWHISNQTNNMHFYQWKIIFSVLQFMEKSNKKSLNLEDFETLNVLGTGSFGKVKLVKNKKTGEYSCVKIMKKEEILNAKQTDHIINQYQILGMISHPFIINFHGMTQNSKLLFLFMEYVAGGQLFKHLREEGNFDVHKTSFYAAQIVLIFQYLHSNNIIYRDLKPENVLIAEDGYIKLTDFGFAKIVENRTFTLCGTPQYLAPQILLNKGHGKPVDWWTFGIILYQMIAGIDPFNDDNPLLVYQNILKCRLKFPHGFDPDAKSLIKHLLTIDLSLRFGNLKNGINDIKKHRFFNNINFANILARKVPVPFKPTVKGSNDTSNFQANTDSESEKYCCVPSEDPFKDWQ